MKKLLLSFLLLLLSFSCKAPKKDCPVSNTSIEIGRTDGGTYDVDTYLIVTEDTCLARISIDSIIKDGDANYSLANVEAMTLSAPGFPVIVWIPHIPKTPYDYATLNHEIFHVTTAIMNYVQIPLSSDTEEAWAYEVGYITRKLLEQIKIIKEK